MSNPNRGPAKENPFRAACAANLASFVIGAEGGNVINVGIQLQDANGNDVVERVSVLAYLSNEANGDAVAGVAIDTVAIGTDGLLIPIVTGKMFQLVSESDGDIDINFTEDGTTSWYLHLIMPDGSIVSSGVFTYV